MCPMGKDRVREDTVAAYPSNESERDQLWLKLSRDSHSKPAFYLSTRICVLKGRRPERRSRAELNEC